MRAIYADKRGSASNTRPVAAGLVTRRGRAMTPPGDYSSSVPQPAAEPLTPREREIVRLVAQGLRNKQIARRLAIAEGTVKIHPHNVYQKAGVDGRGALTLWAQGNGLI